MTTSEDRNASNDNVPSSRMALIFCLDCDPSLITETTPPPELAEINGTNEDDVVLDVAVSSTFRVNALRVVNDPIAPLSSVIDNVNSYVPRDGAVPESSPSEVSVMPEGNAPDVRL